jgi:hypothetical protein
MFYTKKDKKEIYEEFEKVREEIQKSKYQNSTALHDLYDLLAVFGVFRGCSNCKHDQHCVVQGDKCNAWHVEHYGMPKNQTLCSEKYWERAEVKVCDCNK